MSKNYLISTTVT